MTTKRQLLTRILSLAACVAWAVFAARCEAGEYPARDAALAELNAARLEGSAGETQRLRAIKHAVKSGAADAQVIEALCGLLKDPSAEVRRATVAALEKKSEPPVPVWTIWPVAPVVLTTPDWPEGPRPMEWATRSAVPALIEAAADKDPATRATIIAALGVLAPPDKAALPVLVAALKDPSPQLRVTAIEALRRHGAAAKDALPDLIELALREKHPDAINALAVSLAENDPIPPELIPFYVNGLKGSNLLRNRSLAALNKIGPKAAPAMILLLKSDYVSIRRDAASYFEKYTTEAKLAVPQLADAMSDGDVYVRKSAATALGAAGPDALPALPALIKLLSTSTDTFVRQSVANVIANMGAPAKEAIPALVQLMQEKTLASRTAGGKALAKMGAPGASALIELLGSPRDEVRAAAALALPPCGDAAMPGLAEVLKTGNPEAISAALLALDRMGGAREPAIAHVISLMRHKQPAIRQSAATVLGKSGAQAVKPLLDALDASTDAPLEFRSALTDALGRAGKDAVPPLLDIINGKHEGPMFYAAIEALGKVGPPASDATPLLVALLSTTPAPSQAAPPPPVKRTATPVQTPAVPLLPEYVKLDVAVLQALAGFGHQAHAAVPVLFELLKDGDASVRGEAARTISKVALGNERIPPLGEILERCDSSSVAQMLRVFQDAGLEALLIEFDTASPNIRQRISTAFANVPTSTVYPYLAHALKNEEPRIRSGAALAIADLRKTHIGKKAAAVQGTSASAAYLDGLLGALKSAVKDADPDVRVLAAYAILKAVDSEDGEIVEKIATGLAGCAPEYRARGMIALDYYNLEKTGRKAAPALPVLIRLINVDNGNAPTAKQLIQRIGITKDEVPVLVDALKEKNFYTRKAALKMIEALGPEAREATDALIQSMAEEDKGAKLVEPALLAIGQEAVPELIEALKSTAQKIRTGSAQTLVRMNLDGERLEQIAGLLSDNRPEMRISALTVLSSSVERAKYAMPHVSDLLVDSDKFAYRAGLELFAVLGAEATPALLDAIKSTSPQTRARAAIALKPRGTATPPVEALQPLMALLSDDNPDVKAAALTTLSAYNDNGATIVPGLAEAMKDESPLLRRSALVYLKQHGKDAPDAALAALKFGLADTTPKIRILSVDALKELGAPAGPLLFEAIGDADHAVRAAAANALESLGLANDPDKRILIDEMFALDAIEQYARAQEEHFIKSFDANRVHFYASAMGDLAALPKELTDADTARETPVPFNGFKFKMLEGQSASAPGGAKKYLADGKMSQGHALVAFPSEYARTGRFTFIVGDDSTIYKKDLGPETARLCGEMRELNPDDTWTKLKIKPKDEGPVRFHPNDPETGDDMEF